MRPLLYLAAPRSRAQQLAGWLAQVLVERQLLSNRALHLFLQTNYSAQRISENAAGARDDQVVDNVVRDDRKISKDGFRSLFGRYVMCLVLGRGRGAKRGLKVKEGV